MSQRKDSSERHVKKFKGNSNQIQNEKVGIVYPGKEVYQ